MLQLVYGFFSVLVNYTKRLEGNDREKLRKLYSHVFVFCHLLEPLERNRESSGYSSKDFPWYTSGDLDEIVPETV